jgi:primosomal protein N' (replication factor Y)
VRLVLKHRSEERVEQTGQELSVRLRPVFEDRMLGPEPPLVSRVRDQHLRAALFKLRRDAYHEEKKAIAEAIDQVFAMPEHSPVRLVVDVDPM